MRGQDAEFGSGLTIYDCPAPITISEAYIEWLWLLNHVPNKIPEKRGETLVYNP